MNIRSISMSSTALCLCLASLVAPAFAQGAQTKPVAEEIVITAALLGGVRTDLLTSSATVLSPIDLELRQTRIVSDILRDVPGLAVSRGGAVGAITQVRIRSAEGNHTLVLIDGIKASDPFAGEFDFATLLADDEAKVEVLRGEQSALYGSDAIGSVVQYITLSGAEAPGVRARVEGGSFNTFGGTARVAGVSGNFDYVINGAVQRTDGTPDSYFSDRKLGSNNAAISGKFSVAFADNFRVKAVARYSATEADQNQQDFNFPPGPNYGLEVEGNGSYKNKVFYGLLSAQFEGLEGRWRNALTIQGLDSKRDGYGNNFLDADERANGSKSQREKATFVTSLNFGTVMAASKLTASADWEKEFYQNTDPTGFADTSKRHSDNYGYVAQYDFVYDERLALNASGRYDVSYRIENAFTYHLGASYLFDGGFRPHVSTGTGIKAPGIYELYGYTAGPGGYVANPNLTAEKSRGWEVGADQTFFNGIAVARATYFNATLMDEIVMVYNPPDYAASPENATTDSKREGVEALLSVNIGEQWRIDGAFTHMTSSENGQPEVRRPEEIASLNIAWRAMGDKYGANLTVRYNGDQKDFNFTPTGSVRVDMPSYTLVNFGADYRISDAWKIQGRVENLLDKEYEEQFSYRSPGRAFYLGVRATLQ